MDFLKTAGVAQPTKKSQNWDLFEGVLGFRGLALGRRVLLLLGRLKFVRPWFRRRRGRAGGRWGSSGSRSSGGIRGKRWQLFWMSSRWWHAQMIRRRPGWKTNDYNRSGFEIEDQQMFVPTLRRNDSCVRTSLEKIVEELWAWVSIKSSLSPSIAHDDNQQKDYTPWRQKEEL